MALFVSGGLPGLGRPAEAKAKKKIVRRVKVKRVKKKIVRKKVVRRPRVRKARKVSLKARQRLPRVKAAAKPAYSLPARAGTVTQDYTVEEGIGEGESDSLISALRSVGADDVAVDNATNTVSVTFNTSRLTSVGIVRKLKALGYTAKRSF